MGNIRTLMLDTAVGLAMGGLGVAAAQTTTPSQPPATETPNQTPSHPDGTRDGDHFGDKNGEGIDDRQQQNGATSTAILTG